MQRWFHLFTCLIFLMAGQAAQGLELSPNADVALITIAPGRELYSSFGHSAIHIQDLTRKIDKVYNYGVFDFHTPNFYTKFARGKLNYQLAVHDFPSFVDFYRTLNRSIYRKTLNLTEADKGQLYKLLETNARPENKDYLYDFFFANCATKIRDAFFLVLGDRLVLNPVPSGTRTTFRQSIAPYLKDRPWGDLGIALGLGSVVDRPMTPAEFMFLPDYLEAGFANGKIRHQGQQQPLVTAKTTVFQAAPQPDALSFVFRPLFLFWTLFLGLAAFTFWQAKGGIRRFGPDIALLGLTGMIGLLLLLMWVATDHKATAVNLNILWLNPLHLIAGTLLIAGQGLGLVKPYLLGTAALNTLLLLGWVWLPQGFHPAFFPLILLLLLRSLYLFRTLQARKGGEHGGI